jgi:hypothetical protein
MNDIKTCYKLFGIECGEGWYSLIKPILNYIEDYNKDKTIESDKIEILQIKEKFGGLRIYVNFHTPELFEMIEKAESESYNVCELCGSREDMGQTMGWITSMCKKCVMKIAENGFYPKQWYSYNDKKKYWVYPDKIIEKD